MTKLTTPDSKISEKNKRRIIDSAVRAFALNGFKGTSIKQIADDANLPKTNVLYYFSSKQTLYTAVLKDILLVWNSSFDKATAEDDPAMTLANYIAEKMEISRIHPYSSKVFAMEILRGASNLNKNNFAEYQAWMKSRVTVIEAWIEQGKINAMSAEYLLYHIWACTQHYADFSAQITGLRGEKMIKADFQVATRDLIGLILTGCGLNVPEQYKVAL